MTKSRCIACLLSAMFYVAASSTVYATGVDSLPELIQVSGYIMAEDDGQLIAVPYANIFLPDRSRGDVASAKGFFSIVVEPGQELYFSAMGYGRSKLVVPDTLTQDRYHVYQMLTTDTIELPMVVIYPWPDRDHLRQDFLAMDVSDELEERAAKNLSPETMAYLTEITPTSGNENTQYIMRQTAKSYYTYGQLQPMQILNPMAWAKFFEAWKRGDFKKK
jgi:hypothetical protein